MQRGTEQALSNTRDRQAMVVAFTFEIGSLSNVLRISVGDKLQENRAYCLTPDSHIRSRVDCSIFESGLIASVAVRLFLTHVTADVIFTSVVSRLAHWKLWP